MRRDDGRQEELGQAIQAAQRLELHLARLNLFVAGTPLEIMGQLEALRRQAEEAALRGEVS